MSKLEKTREWICHQFHDAEVKKPIAALKQHRHGGLTHVQELRLWTATNEELHDTDWIRQAA
jgi:hypothetical protein